MDDPTVKNLWWWYTNRYLTWGRRGVGHKTHLGFRSPCRHLVPVRSASSGIRDLEVMWTMAPRQQGVFDLYYGCFSVSFWGWWGGDYILKAEKGPPHPILAPVVRLALAEGMWSRVPGGFPRIWSVFVFLGVVSVSSDLQLSILVMFVVLVHWSFTTYDFPYVYYNKLY
jgi:hypothetical protein